MVNKLYYTVNKLHFTVYRFVMSVVFSSKSTNPTRNSLYFHMKTQMQSLHLE